MKLRARLMIAFLLLAVIPLTGLVTLSYASSRRAFRRAVEKEAGTQAEAMNRRLRLVRGALDQGLGEAAQAAAAEAPGEDGSEVQRDALLAKLRQAMGPAAPLVQAFEWIPAAPEPAGAPAAVLPAPAASESSAPVAVPAPLRTLVIPNPLPRTARETTGRDQPAAALPAPPSRAEIDEIVRQATEQATLAQQQAMEQVASAQQEVMKKLQKLPPRQREQASRWVEAAGAVVKGFESEKLRVEEMKQLEHARAQAEKLLGQELSRPVEANGRVVGHLRVQVRAQQLLHGVLAAARRDEGEIPFAVDQQGQLYTVDPADEEALAGLPLAGDGSTTAGNDQWVISRTTDKASSITFGIARPVGEGLAEIRRTAARNLGLGLAFIGLAALGIVPVSRRMTRNLGTLTGAATALADGDLDVRVPVRSSDEIGQLAASFNHMAGEIQRHQRQLVEEERLRSEQELQHRLLEVENERKSRELEEARRFQLALLPTRLPDHPEVEIAVSMHTATEVGGDYYDFRVADNGALVTAIGDATGHGATAGTMVTMIKSLFTVSEDPEPQRFLERAAGAIRGMNLGRMNMALSLVRIHRGRMVVSAAGMPPLLLHRKTSGEIEEVTVEGMPLGGLAGATYRQTEVSLAPGDTALLMSDGFPELLNHDGEPLGYERARALFAEAVAEVPEPATIVARLEAAAERWRGGDAPNDDVTFVVLKARST